MPSKLLVWHPAVHAEFGERLYFFLVRVRGTLTQLADAVRAEMTSRRIRSSSACYYPLFGIHDLLIRAWMTKEQSDKFASEWREVPLIEDLHPFEVEEVHYTWAEKSEDPRRVQEYVRSRVLELREFQDAPSQEKITEYRKAGILIDVAELNSSGKRPIDGVKFFCLARHRLQGQVIPHDRVLSFVRDRTPSEGQPGVRAVSVYFGLGFCEILIKGVATHYREVGKFLGQFLEEFSPFGVSTSTFLCVHDVFDEDDSVCFRDIFDSSALNYARSLVGLTPAEVQTNLTQEQLQTLHSGAQLILDEAGQRLDNVPRPRYRRWIEFLVRGYIFQNEDEVIGSLVILTTLEPLLKSVLPLFMGRIFGVDWYKEHFGQIMAEVTDRVGKEQGRKLDPDKVREFRSKDFSLDVLIPFLGEALAVARRKKGVDKPFPELTDIPNWWQRLESARALRNDFAHGSGVVSAPLANWLKITEVVARIIPIIDCFQEFLAESKED